MKKIFKVLPLLAIIASCGQTTNEVNRDSFDNFAHSVSDTSGYTKITASSIITSDGYEYVKNSDSVKEADYNQTLEYVIEKVNGEWATTEQSQYVLQYAQSNILANYETEVIADKELGDWHYYLNPAQIVVLFEEDQMDGEVVVHFAQRFVYQWDNFGRITYFLVETTKTWKLNGRVDGYGDSVWGYFTQSLTVSYE